MTRRKYRILDQNGVPVEMRLKFADNAEFRVTQFDTIEAASEIVRITKTHHIGCRVEVL